MFDGRTRTANEKNIITCPYCGIIKRDLKKLVASSFYQFCVIMHSFQSTNCCLALFEKGIAGTNLQVESFSCSEQIITSAFHSAYSTGRSVLHEPY